MDTIQSKDVVRGMIEEDGTLLVSFRSHAAYYRVPGSPNKIALKQRLLKSQREEEEICFTFDRDLNIVKISG